MDQVHAWPEDGRQVALNHGKGTGEIIARIARDSKAHEGFERENDREGGGGGRKEGRRGVYAARWKSMVGVAGGGGGWRRDLRGGFGRAIGSTPL